MSLLRQKRTAQNAANTPVVAHVKGFKAISKARAEAILGKFISTSEAIAAAIPGTSDEIAFTNTGLSNAAGGNPVLGQLKRVQRDLRGLPPLLAELDSVKHTIEESSEQPQNKKIKFDEDSETQEVEEEAAELEAESTEVKVDEPAEVVAQAVEETVEAPEEAVTEAADEEKKQKKEKKDKKKKEKKEKKAKKEKKEEEQ